ncbi:transcription termination factor, mitochondrial isoform X1 [Spodoptera litura]|uniref:Transcription termination factor, mitochondrial isoform X1 n=1 Tax=Spodoptera litura TaxID=69820 RepID=A0A9J7E1J6_SPOLT|nr:transcription termination factor, mitochondrial isoform X1 [Spodoptera litura]
MAIRTIISKLKPTYLSLCSSAFKIIPTTIIQNVLSRPPCDIFIKVPIVSIASYATRTKTTEKSGLNATKAKIILALNFQSAEDALPFYKLPLKTLIHVLKITKNDESKGFCKNRLYYIASRLKVPPSVLSEKLAKRTFIYSLSFDWIEKALDVLIEMNVASDRILRDLWVLKYHHETVHERLLKVKNLGIDNLYPWMVRCSEDILNRYITISTETKDILGETNSKQTYLANRLNVSVDTVQEMCFKIPALKAIRVTKVKHFLDFLESEGFDVEEIANKPRVLSASQKTVKKRLDTLRNLGLKEINLNVLCRSKKDFKKYCESIESLTDQDT